MKFHLFLLLAAATASLTGANYCDICKGLTVTKPAMVVNMLYYGVASCRSLYKQGLGGLIPAHMCDAFQHYAFEPCGCKKVEQIDKDII